MPQSYTGEVRDGVIVFESTPPPLPKGSKVRVEPVEPDDSSIPTLAERYAAIIGIVKDLPPDMAAQPDHDIHGTPGRDVE